jgi:hypothetical protein
VSYCAPDADGGGGQLRVRAGARATSSRFRGSRSSPRDSPETGLLAYLEDASSPNGRQRRQRPSAPSGSPSGIFAAAAERDRLRAENEALREAVARHANEIDPKVLAMVEIPAEHRDAIDNKMYNAVRALDPQWWDKKVPGLNAIFGAGASDEKGHADAS